MPRRVVEEEDYWDGDDDWDSDEQSLEDIEESGEVVTEPCPYCKQPIPEDTPRCPYCQTYVSQEDAPPQSRKPWWIIIGSLAVMYVVYRWIKNW